MSLSMNPLKQGLKLCPGVCSILKPLVFIHESIKTRVETSLLGTHYGRLAGVFIHESIKTRVETVSMISSQREQFKSLSMNPLKQGLKLTIRRVRPREMAKSLSMNPLKQGLKPIIFLSHDGLALSLYP